jgi:hypothetical protein
VSQRHRPRNFSKQLGDATNLTNKYFSGLLFGPKSWAIVLKVWQKTSDFPHERACKDFMG